jgi:phosphopantetheinyl transferase
VLAELYASGKPLALDRLFAGRTETQPAAARGPRTAGVALDNTMPMLRLSADERTRLQALAAKAGTTSESKAPEATAAPTATTEDRVALPSTSSTTGNPVATARLTDAPSGEQTRAEALARPEQGPPMDGDGGARNAVMADYFQLMRGFLAQQHDVIAAWQTPVGTARPSSAATSPMPLLDEVCEHDAARIVARCHLSLVDNFLRSHVLSGPVSAVDPELSGLACVPLTVSLEIMAEACAVLADTRALQAIENVRAFDWIALDDGALTLEVHAEAIDAPGGRYRAQLLNGAAPAAVADFLFAAEPVLEGVAPLDDPQPYRWSGPELYTTGMFHGPVFQSIRRVDGWSASGIDATLADGGLDGFRHDGRTPDLVLDPVLLDAVGQLAAYWTAQQVGTDFNSFPSTIARIELYTPCPGARAGRVLRGRQRPLDAGADDTAASRSWSFECLDAAGTPLFRVGGLVNVFFEVPHGFYEVRRDPLLGLLGHASAARPAAGVALWEVPHFGEAFCAQSSGIFLRILAHALLSHDEREAWRTLEGSVKHRRQWLLGRAAIKEAVRVLLYEHTGHLLHPSDITVVHDAHGAPAVDGWWSGRLAAPPNVSLSHTERTSLAAAAFDAPLGVDLEDLGRVQRPELLAQALTPGERAALHGLAGEALEEGLLRVWCAKEAAAKRLGIGMLGSPDRFDVRFADDALDRAWVDFEGSVVGVDIVRDGRSVIALAGDPVADPVGDAAPRLEAR